MRHLILGAGPVGRSTAEALARRQQEVHLVSRSLPAGLPPGVVHSPLDARHPTALREACAGSQVVYQCLNAPYHRWATEFPPLQEAAVRAARTAGARFVSFENVYMYGMPGTAPFAEGQPHRPCAEKGRVRAAMAEELQRLQARGELQVAQVRASDLFGPGTRGSALGEELIGRAVAGKKPRGLGNLALPHTWTYTLDAGETLARVGVSAEAFGKVWHVPSDAPRSQLDIARALSTLLGRPVALQATPVWLLRLVGMFRPEAGAMVEMAYEFEHPFVVGDSAARAALGQGHTAFDEALATTVRGFAVPVSRAPRQIGPGSTGLDSGA